MISPIVYVVDDDDAVRNALDMQIEAAGFCVETFSSCTDFLAMLPSNASGCLLLDVRMPDMTGPQLQIEMTKRGIKLPIIFISGYGNIALAVETVQAGAIDFLTKQVNAQQLFSRIQTALALNSEYQQREKVCFTLDKQLKKLTKREHEVFTLVIEGYCNKTISAQLGISARTVEHHRSKILQKTETDNFLKLSRLIDSCQ